MFNWNDDWRDELMAVHPRVYDRLCECRNTKRDIAIMSALMYKYNKGRSTTDSKILHDKYLVNEYSCVDRMLEWVGDWNDQDFDMSSDEYDRICEYVRKYNKEL